MVNPSQIRQVIRGMKSAVERQIFPARRETPNALVFAQPYQRREFSFEMIEDLHRRLGQPPLKLATERLWGAHIRVLTRQAKGVDHRWRITAGSSVAGERPPAIMILVQPAKFDPAIRTPTSRTYCRGQD